MIEIKNNDNFFVITGGPGAGKTTLLNALKKRGYKVVSEIAREIIKEQKEINGQALPWKNRELYKDIMFERSILSYEQLDKQQVNENPIFFDRGFLDTFCYVQLIQSELSKRMKTYAENYRYNKMVFVLPPWLEIYAKDSERKQDWEEAVITHRKMIETYGNYGYEIIEVPKVSVKERVDFVLNKIGLN